MMANIIITDIAANEIQHVDLTVDEYVVQTEKHVVQIPVSEVETHIMNRCRTYFTSELADLSIGGASPLKDWSIIVLRTKKSEEFFDRAVQKGVIATRKIEDEPETLAHLIQLSTHKRNMAFQEIKAMREKGIPVPTAADFSAGPVASEISVLKKSENRRNDDENCGHFAPEHHN